jgi:hypothetical protein
VFGDVLATGDSDGGGAEATDEQREDTVSVRTADGVTDHRNPRVIRSSFDGRSGPTGHDSGTK